MKLSFRHGIVTYYQDISGNPLFLQIQGSNVNLMATQAPTTINISHGESDYLFTERQDFPAAWQIVPSVDQWLFWDINIITAIRTFGTTLFEPIVSATPPPSPAQDQHWYDSTETVMKVRKGNLWQPKLRVFAAKLASGAIIQPFPLGTHVGISNVTVFSGFILFDDDQKAIKRGTKRRDSNFVHTESTLASNASGGITSFVLDNTVNVAERLKQLSQYPHII